MNGIRYRMFITTIFLALVMSAVNVAPVFADEGTPPPTEPAAAEEEALPPSEEPAPVSEEESTTVAEVIESLPEDTELVVVNESGEALPLATEEAADVIETADPRWCPVGIAPGGAGCSPVFTKFNGVGGLIEWLDANNPNKAGVIWVEKGYQGTVGLEGGIIILDGADYGTMNTFALTINGGWNGGALTTMDTNDLSEFNVPLQITGWLGAITINNVLITGASGGAGVESLNVTTTGNITLNNVDVQDNNTQSSGAELSNSAGTGTVVVNDSTFNENNGSVNSGGLSIISKGTVTLKNVTASGNALYGVNIYNVDAATPKAVTLNGTNQFSYNGGDGLSISTKGIITINNVTAIRNTGGSGANLDNCDYNTGTDLCNYTSAAGVTIKGTNNFSDNGWDGLRVSSGGVISISNITANNNGTDPLRSAATNSLADDNAFGKGVYLNNYGALTQKAITLTGTSTFNGNASIGLTAISYGLISVSNLTASANGCDPLFEDGSYCAGAYLYAEGGITQTGYGRFEDNTGAGLIVDAQYKGAVTLNNLYADENGGIGTLVTGFGLAPVNVTINGTNIFTNNLNIGLVITTDGAVTLNNLTANGNSGSGVEVNNALPGYVKAVTIKGVNTFNGNGGDGLLVETNGAIVTYALTATGNTGNGAYLFNCGCVTPTTQAVTLNGNNYFDDNDVAGLHIESNGVITVNNLTSTFNGDNGVYLNNAFSNPANPAVTIKGFAFVINNAGNGLQIFSNGAVTLANITANGNTLFGVDIDNLGNALKPGNVTITGNNIFNSNTGIGLSINTYGIVLLNNLTANENTGSGVYIDNSTGSLAKSVTLNGNNMFNINGDTGLDINSLGAIKINNVMANGSITGSGAVLVNDAGLFTMPVTITGYGIFNNNNGDGLKISSNGALTFANLTANGNTGYGADIDTQYNNLTNTTYANVTLTGVNTFNDNGSYGLSVFSDGNITVSNITANNNGLAGAYLNNDLYANPGTTGIRTVTVSGVNMFNGNDVGLEIYSNGTVSLTRITADNNDNGASDGTGLLVLTDGAINLTCGSMYNNTDFGYYLSAGAGKAITIKGVFTYSNGLGNITNNTPIVTRTCPLP